MVSYDKALDASNKGKRIRKSGLRYITTDGIIKDDWEIIGEYPPGTNECADRFNNL
jgi:hypothetical protein